MSEMKLIYVALSKKLFYFRMQISTFVINKGHVPLNPFMIWDYFLNEAVDREAVKQANDTIVRRADEIWIFGEIADGVLYEIKIAKQMNKPIKYFDVIDSKDIVEITKDKVSFEEGLEKFRNEL
jgi:hypothetical protein